MLHNKPTKFWAWSDIAIQNIYRLLQNISTPFITDSQSSLRDPTFLGVSLNALSPNYYSIELKIQFYFHPHICIDIQLKTSSVKITKYSPWTFQNRQVFQDIQKENKRPKSWNGQILFCINRQSKK